MNDGISSKLTNFPEFINFSKMRGLYNIICRVQKFQKCYTKAASKFIGHPEAQSYIEGLVTIEKESEL
jgi:hypothetical protein